MERLNLYLMSLLLLASGPVSASAVDLSAYLYSEVGLIYSDNATLDDGKHNATTYQVTTGGRAELPFNAAISGQFLLLGHDAQEALDPYVDYLFIGKSFYQQDRKFLDLNLGRVKVPYGLFNESRDIAFSRASYELPSSIYFESLGGRDTFFSADGGRIDLYYSVNDWDLQLASTLGRERDLDERGEQTFFGDLAEILDAKQNVDSASQFSISDTLKTRELKLSFIEVVTESEFNGRSISGGINIFPDSFLSLLPVVTARAKPSNTYTVDIDIWVISARYEPNRLQLIAELARNRSKILPSSAPSYKGNAGYLQAGWRWSPELQIYTQYEWRNLFDDNQDEDAFVAAGPPRHRSYFHRSTVGLEKRFTPDLRAYASLSYTEGTLNILATSFSDAEQLNKHWFSGRVALAWQF